MADLEIGEHKGILITPDNFLHIDGSGHYLLLDGSNHVLLLSNDARIIVEEE